MSELQTRNTATSGNATGLLAPLMRVSTHIGWCISFVSEQSDDADFVEMLSTVQNDLYYAQLHIDDAQAAGNVALYAGTELVNLFNELKRELTWFNSDNTSTKSELLENLKTMADNYAFLGAMLERKMTGNETASAGTEL